MNAVYFGDHSTILRQVAAVDANSVSFPTCESGHQIASQSMGN
jgi:hypothetical protein